MVNATLELPANVTQFDLVDSSGASIPYQTRGLWSREVINVTMDVKEFRTAFGWVSDGRVAGMIVQDLKIRREDKEVFIDAIVSDGGEPNLTVWKVGRKQVDEYLADPAITTYHVRALSASATRITLTAHNIPANGFQTLWLRPRPDEGKTARQLSPLVKMLLPLANLSMAQRLLAPRKKYARPPYIIENDFIKIQIVSDGTFNHHR